MMTTQMFYRIAPIVLTASAIVACSTDPKPFERPKPIPVHGLVRYNGKPLDGARVTFDNTAVGVSAYGVTDADGKFTLTTFEPGDGAVPGPQKIAVVKAQETGHAAVKDAPPVFRSGGAPHPRWLIPKRYSSVATSGLTAEVVEGSDKEIILDLQGSAP